MKKIITFLMMLGCIALNAQNSADKFTTGSSDQARNPLVDQMNFVPNEVLVKFKDEVPLNSAVRLRSAGLSAVDKVLQANGIDSLVRLFPTTKSSLFRSSSVGRIVKDPQGRDMKIPNLDKIYKITIPQLRSTSSVPENIFQVIEDLKALPEVEYAEPNYIYSVDDLQPVGPVLTADDVKKMQGSLRSTQSAVVPNDPLYAQQWYIPAVKADLVWEQTTGDTTQVIGILDTGVDWNHPDLKNKIWTNPGEIPGNGIDDDGNGLIDDIRGWDYINNDNNPMDDNSHGTHVAGIAAAETNNGIGIAGVNWNAKIMPLKVFQSSGRGDAANIAKAIIYATIKGATVINMSFGSYARSLAMEDALANAYATTILVAAAGNDALALESCIPSGQFFPACLSYVLGVQSPEASFSNYDCNGPTFSNTSDLVNYEMKAPGTNVISTIPNGNYRVYQGTSMATPIVSAAVSLYRKLIPYEEETNEFMWVKLIQATEQYLDINKALTIVPKPEIWFLNNVMVDTLALDDKDGRVDAGETIQLWFRARNTGGQVDSVYWKIQLAEFEDTTTCDIVKPTSFLGSISPYATRTSESDPMKFIISNNVAHDRDITFDLFSWYKGATDTIIQKFVFTAENGEQLSGVLDGVKILYPNRLYLVNNSFKVGVEGTLIIKPGTKILFYPGKTVPVSGKLIAEGKPDSLIYFEGYSPPSSPGSVGTIFSFRNDRIIKNRLSYCRFDNINWPLSSDNYMNPPSAFNCIFIGNVIGIVDSLVNNYYYGSSSPIYTSYGLISKNNFLSPSTSSSYYFSNSLTSGVGSEDIKRFTLNNFVNFSIGQESIRENDDPAVQNVFISEYSKPYHSYNDGFYKDTRVVYTKYRTYTYPNNSADFKKIQYQYWGTSDSTKIEGFIEDFMENSTWPRAKFKPFLNAPPEECHGIVWKVLVNGKDAQDEKVEPVGVGKQRFDVYFNRPMNKTILPQVSFGVRYPFSSIAVNEDGTWSDDGRIYTAYKNVKLTTGDGINRVRVTGAKDLEGWEIPTEDMRFEFLISAASSASLDFMATPGLGKVKLEWNNNDLADGLGYNMYRMEHINDSTLTSPVIINTSLINDTLYTDYSVVPNRKYYYTYKVVRTDLSETDPSKVVSAVPFTAAKGDANGDLSVNVLDITTIVAYLLNNNPQPFIYEAADMNSDGNINVLDIVGVVNQVLYGGIRSANVAEDQQASLYLRNDTLFADATTAIGGLQFDVSGVTSINDIQVLDALQAFESGYSQRDSSTLRLLYYSMSGKSIAAGNRIPLLKLKKACKLKDVIVSDKAGAAIPVSLSDPTIGNRNDQGMTVAELGQNYPNPSKGQTTLPVQIFEKVDEAAISIYNMLGQQVKVIKLDNPTVGKHEVQWNSLKDKGLFIYNLEIRSGGQQYVSPLKKMIVL